MPILFLIAGIVNLCIVFDFVSFRSQVVKKFFCVGLWFLLLGFFMGDLFLCHTSFNVFFLLAFLVFFLIMLFNFKFRFCDLICSFVVGVLYYYLLSLNLIFMIGYSSILIELLLLSIVIVCAKNLYKTILLSVLFSLVVTLISGGFGFENFGVLELDFLFCFEVVIYSCLFYFIKFYLSCLILKFLLRSEYVKKGACVYDFCNVGCQCLF